MSMNKIITRYRTSPFCYRTLTLAEATATKQAGIRIISIGVGSGYDENELNGMASDPVSENVFTVDDFDKLTSILSDVCERVESIERKNFVLYIKFWSY